MTRLSGQLKALRHMLTTSFALTEALQAGTIEKVLAKDDVELAVEYLLGLRFCQLVDHPFRLMT